MKKIAVGLSGGVDSAVSVLLLQQEGFQPVGVFLRMHDVGSGEEDARRAAKELGISFYIKDMRKDFEEKVVRPFAELYKKGTTPNPCILCNPAVKFRGLLQAADALGCENIATGHYASVETGSGRHLIRRIPGQEKDQSYMLYRLDENCRGRLLLPLGGMPDKQAVRDMAERNGLSAADQKDSLDICFLEPGCSHGAFIEKYTGSPPRPGDILDASGRILGRHEGVCYYTVGQRRGLGVPSDGRKYVAALDAENNTVVLDEKEALETATVYLRDVVLHLPLPDEGITAKIRYRDQDTPVEVELLEGNRAILHFEQPKFAPAPGQSAVFYWENCLLGGGVIERGGREQ